MDIYGIRIFENSINWEKVRDIFKQYSPVLYDEFLEDNNGDSSSQPPMTKVTDLECRFRAPGFIHTAQAAVD